MYRTIQSVDHVFRKIIKVEETGCVILQIVMLVICFAAVIKRYFFNAPWTWTDEIQLLLLVVYGYMAISVDVYRDNHVALTGFYKHLPRRGQILLDLVRHILMGGFFCFMTYYGWKIYLIKARKLLTVTHLSQGIVFMAQTVCAALMVLYCVMNLVKAARCMREAGQGEEAQRGEEG